MNNRVRQELRALRIDPDATFQLDSGVGGRVGSTQRAGVWSRHTTALVLGVCAIVCVLLFGAAMLAARIPSSAAQASPRIVTHMAFAGLEADIAEPVYRALATDGTTPSVQWMTLHMDVANVSDATVAVEAGELILVDARGALFAPSWREPGGATRDGFGAPDHTLFGLAPGGTTEVTLVFIIRDGGQYWLRFTRPGAATSPGDDVPLPIR